MVISIVDMKHSRPSSCGCCTSDDGYGPQSRHAQRRGTGQALTSCLERHSLHVFLAISRLHQHYTHSYCDRATSDSPVTTHINMATHTRKKQIQPSSQSSIRSYFDRSLGTNSPTFSSTTPPLCPPVPQAVQFSLLNVGMRVRKSVPEGYKTHKTLVTCSQYDAPPAPMTHTVHVTESRAPPSSAPPNLYTRDSSRELLPFCGLHSIGGIPDSQQPQTSTPSLSAMPSLTSQSSYGSVSMHDASPYAELKRSYSEDIEDDLDEYFDQGTTSGQVQDRVFAKPKTRWQIGTATGGKLVIADDFSDHDVTFLDAPA